MTAPKPTTFRFTGSHTEPGPVENGTRIFLDGGDLTLEGPVGDNVVIEVQGNLTLKADAGKSLYAFATGDVKMRNVGRDSDITAANGKAAAYTLGENSWLRGKFSAAVEAPDVKCGNHNIYAGPEGVALYRKPDPALGDALPDPDSCMKPQPLPKTPKH